MKISKQVCSLFQAKRLRELGIAQNSFLYWYGDDKMEGAVWSVAQMLNSTDSNYSAFTSAELGVMIGNQLATSWLCTMFGSKFVAVSEICDEINQGGGMNYFYETPCNINCTSEADARAVYLIHLLETKKLTAEECNTRLFNA